jgi:hypothetical protein
MWLGLGGGYLDCGLVPPERASRSSRRKHKTLRSENVEIIAHADATRVAALFIWSQVHRDTTLCQAVTIYDKVKRMIPSSFNQHLACATVW